MIDALALAALLAVPPQCIEFAWKCLEMAPAPAAVTDLAVVTVTSRLYTMNAPWNLQSKRDPCEPESLARSNVRIEAWKQPRIPSGPPDSTASRGATWFYDSATWIAHRDPQYVGSSPDLRPGDAWQVLLPDEVGAQYLFRARNYGVGPTCWAAWQAWR